MAAPSRIRRARLISSAIAPSFSRPFFVGRVHSVFRRPSTLVGDGNLISIVTLRRACRQWVMLDDDSDLPIETLRPGSLAFAIAEA